MCNLDTVSTKSSIEHRGALIISLGLQMYSCRKFSEKLSEISIASNVSFDLVLLFSVCGQWSVCHSNVKVLLSSFSSGKLIFSAGK